MRAASLAVCAFLAACGGAPLSPPDVETAVAAGSFAVPYPQLPRCECGCVGELCTTGAMGVVVCGTNERPGAPAILPPPGAAAFSD